MTPPGTPHLQPARRPSLGAAPPLATLAVLLGLAASLCSARALASPEYTDTLRSALDLDCAPRCTVCHEDSQGGLGTIRPGSLGETLVRVADLGPEDPDRLACALQLLEPSCEEPPACAAAEQTCFPADTDADGMADVDELRAARDPNTDGVGFLCGPAYGCGAQLSPPAAETPASGVLALALAGCVAASRLARRALGRR
jgi:hypothetical protein